MEKTLPSNLKHCEKETQERLLENLVVFGSREVSGLGSYSTRESSSGPWQQNKRGWTGLAPNPEVASVKNAWVLSVEQIWEKELAWNSFESYPRGILTEVGGGGGAGQIPRARISMRWAARETEGGGGPAADNQREITYSQVLGGAPSNGFCWKAPEKAPKRNG